MKKLLIIAVAIIILGAGSVWALQGETFVCEIQSCSYTNPHLHRACAVAGCTQSTIHEHDGTFYLAHNKSDGHLRASQTASFVCDISECNETTAHSHAGCTVAGCGQMTDHRHNGIIYYGHSDGDGHAYHRCGLSGCLQNESHTHNSCGVGGCSKTDNHRHENGNHHQGEGHGRGHH